jgi:hypothetical protein
MAQAPPPAGRPAGTAQNGLALAGMITGIAGIVLDFLIPIVGILAGAAGAVLGFMGRQRAVQMGGVGAGQATAGIVTGIIAVVLGIIWIAFVAAVVF